MADEELVFETVAGLASLIERREVSPVALVEAYLEPHRPAQRPSYTPTSPSAANRPWPRRERPRRRSRTAGIRGRFMGFPIGLKDQFLTKGVRTTGGSRIHSRADAG